MSRWPPYQLGMWLADVVGQRCVLCRLYAKDSAELTLKLSPPLDDPTNLPADHPQQFLINQRSPTKSSLLCQACHQAIIWNPPVFHIDVDAVDVQARINLSIQSASYYEYPLRPAITSFKHRQDMTKLPFLVHALRQLPRPKGCHANNSVILPMPTTKSRLTRRGFEPVTILSHYLSRHWQIPLWQGVKRVDDSLSQQGLSRAERLTNLDHAFELSEQPPVAKILLFDDVATTGASLRSLALTLTASKALMTDEHQLISAYALAHGNKMT